MNLGRKKGEKQQNRKAIMRLNSKENYINKNNKIEDQRKDEKCWKNLKRKWGRGGTEANEKLFPRVVVFLVIFG